jgi:hypothetical protein
MKWKLFDWLFGIVMMVLFVGAGLSACKQRDTVSDHKTKYVAGQFDTYYNSGGITIITDTMSNCQYVAYNGLTPRLDASGKPLCGQPQDAPIASRGDQR